MTIPASSCASHSALSWPHCVCGADLGQHGEALLAPGSRGAASRFHPKLHLVVLDGRARSPEWVELKFWGATVKRRNFIWGLPLLRLITMPACLWGGGAHAPHDGSVYACRFIYFFLKNTIIRQLWPIKCSSAWLRRLCDQNQCKPLNIWPWLKCHICPHGSLQSVWLRRVCTRPLSQLHSEEPAARHLLHLHAGQHWCWRWSKWVHH